MFAIKIAYKGKNFLLSKGTDSMKKIKEELISRFPGDFVSHGVAISYQGKPITQFEQIQAIAVASGSKSLKLEAEQVQPKELSVIEQENKSGSVSAASVQGVDPQIKQQNQKKEEAQPEIKTQQHFVPEVKKVEIDDIVSVHEEENSNQTKEINVVEVNADPEVSNSNKEKKEQVQIETEHKPQIIKCAIFGQAPVQQEPKVIKCTIFNEILKQIECQFKKEDHQPASQAPKEQLKQEQPKQEHKEEVKHEQKQILKKQSIESQKQQEEENEPEQQNYEQYVSQIREPAENLLCEISPGVYECFYCRPFQVCNVCDNKRKIGKNSKFFMFVEKIVDNKIQEKIQQIQKNIMEKIMSKVGNLKENQIVKKVQKVEEIIKKKGQITEEIKKQRDSIKSAFFEILDHSDNKKESQLSDDIFWNFHIKTKKQFNNRHKACLIEQKTGEITNIDLSNNTFIKVGPYKAKEHDTKLEKTYKLGFINEDGDYELFGPKFGFSVNIAKTGVKKVLTNGFRLAIEQIKKGYKIEKNTEYLIEKLKELGIVEENFEENKAIIPDIFSTL